jgi:hypothetical protein
MVARLLSGEDRFDSEFLANLLNIKTSRYMNIKANLDFEYDSSEVSEMIASEVKSVIEKEVKKVSEILIKQQIEVVIKSKVEKWVDDSLAGYRFEVGNSSNVETITIEEKMQRVFVAFMNEKVDPYGHTSYSGQKRIDMLIRNSVQDIYDNHIKKDVEKAKQEIKSQINDKLMQEVSNKMKEILFSK